MKRKHRTILVFFICELAVLAAMGWLTLEIFKLQGREARAQSLKETQSKIRVALWRMDSFAQVFMAAESARPHLYYNSFFSPEQAYYMTQGKPGGDWVVACADDYRVPSPLLTAEPEFCRLHFQISPADDGSLQLGSPRYPPTQENREFASKTQNVRQQELVTAGGLMEQLKAMARPERLVHLARSAHGPNQPTPLADPDAMLAVERISSLFERSTSPQSYGQSEWSLRQQTANQARNAQQFTTAPISMDAESIQVSSLNPVWLSTDEQSPELVLLRTVRIKRPGGAQEVVQGIWVDWPALRDSMLTTVKDIFPQARLVPSNSTVDDPERLATVPVVLRAGPPAGVLAAPSASGNAMLYIAWGAVLASLLAVGFVLRAIMDLGERRGRFVSAVTHELRTPLTTFCLYSEMLADGMVRDETRKSEYLATLKRESQRLAKIVENVLCYARLSEVRATAHPQQLDALELVDRIVPALARRAGEAGMTLVTELDPARGAVIDVDPQTVERVLLNLVDNSCKYAHDHAPDGFPPDNRIHVTATPRPGAIEFVVADHGPGIPKTHRRSIFKAFNRANAETAPAAPGLGLGLSLARGLARELGGDLRLSPLPSGFRSGAAMSLVIPATWSPEPGRAPGPATTASGIA